LDDPRPDFGRVDAPVLAAAIHVGVPVARGPFDVDGAVRQIAQRAAPIPQLDHDMLFGIGLGDGHGSKQIGLVAQRQRLLAQLVIRGVRRSRDETSSR
jgi:hypothetical protein